MNFKIWYLVNGVFPVGSQPVNQEVYTASFLKITYKGGGESLEIKHLQSSSLKESSAITDIL